MNVAPPTIPPHVIDLGPDRLQVTHSNLDRGCGLCTLVLVWDLEGVSLPQPITWDEGGRTLTGTLRR